MTPEQYKYDSSTANYNSSEKNIQNNVGYGLTFEPAGKAPVIANRIFTTYAAAKAYIDDSNGSAIAGITLSVVGDTSTNNGSYEVVKKSGEPNGLALKKHTAGMDYEVGSGLRMTERTVAGSEVKTVRTISVRDGVGINIDSSNNVSVLINEDPLTKVGANDTSCNVLFVEKKDRINNKTGLAGKVMWTVWK